MIELSQKNHFGASIYGSKAFLGSSRRIAFDEWVPKGVTVDAKNFVEKRGPNDFWLHQEGKEPEKIDIISSEKPSRHRGSYTGSLRSHPG